jgi:serine/threonine protein kinase/formylglycine-generating enzyme required for sulfatase activity
MNTTDYSGQSGTGVSAGRVLGGRYRLDALIAGGGMGEVYRATRLHIGDQVAVKVLRAELVDNAITRERFQREARAAAMLRHPNAVVIHDFGEDADGPDNKIAFIVMELLDGRSLRQVLDEEGPLEPARVNPLLAQMCAVLAEGHKQGIIHRDLKPENVVINQPPGMAEQVKLLDFGIAKLLDKDHETGQLEPALTKVGTFIGTPSYMSPEQCQSEPVDARSDIYSLGVMLYELLTGQVPFTAKTPTGVAIKHVMEAPAPLRNARPDLSEAVEQVVLRALGKSPEVRQATVLQLRQEFAQAVQDAEPGHATNALPSEPGASAAKPSVPTLLDPATRILTSSRDTQHQQKRNTGQQEPSYDTTIGNAVQVPENSELAALAPPVAADAPPVSVPLTAASAVPLAVSEERPSSAGLDTQRLAKQEAGATAVGAADNSPAALWARLKEQPLLLLAGAALAGLALFAWWLTTPRPASEPVRTVAEIPGDVTPGPSLAATPTATPAQSFDEMVFIPGGSLLLNASLDGKCPTVPVTIKPFYLDKKEVTNDEYLLFLVANSYTRPPSWKDGQFPAGAGQLPVTDVSWEDAANYAAWMNKRLPTEAEWEFVARGGTTGAFPWGAEWRADYANVGSKQLQPVGTYPAAGGPFGVLDLIGNAAEWTATDFSACAKDEPGSPSSETASKVVRGGSYETAVKQLSAAYRQELPAKRQGKANFKTVGFRCAREVQ